MSHFANVKDGKVVSVIVAEQSFIDAIPGQWVKTSYNTRGGFHYDLSGRPDGQPELRKNFAAIGNTYDAVRDAFYMPWSSSFKYLDEASCTWIPCLPYQGSTINRDSSVGSNVRIYAAARNSIDQYVWLHIMQTLNLQFVTDPSAATNALPLSNAELGSMINSSTLNSITGIAPALYKNISIRSDMDNLNIPVIHTVLPLSEADVRSLPASPIVIKHNTAALDSEYGLGYKEYATPNEFLQTTNAAFWLNQNSTSKTVIVIQPLLSYPQTTLKLQLSINAQSDVLVWAKSKQIYQNSSGISSCTPFTGDCTALVDSIKNVCKIEHITCSFHELEFASIDGAWTLINWNPHLAGPMVECFPMAYPVLNDPFLHMIGQPIENETSDLYYEERTYDERMLTADAKTIGLQLGLFVSSDTKITKCASIGETSNIVQSRFNKFESICK